MKKLIIACAMVYVAGCVGYVTFGFGQFLARVHVSVEVRDVS